MYKANEKEEKRWAVYSNKGWKIKSLFVTLQTGEVWGPVGCTCRRGVGVTLGQQKAHTARNTQVLQLAGSSDLAGKDLFPSRTAGLWRALLSWSAGKLPMERETFLLTARKAKNLWTADGNRWRCWPRSGKGSAGKTSPRRGDTTEGDEDSLPYRTSRGLFSGKLSIYQCCKISFLFLILPSFLLHSLPS